MKKFLSVLVAVCLVLSLSVASFAADTSDASATLKSALTAIIQGVDSTLSEEEAARMATVYVTLYDTGAISDGSVTKDELLTAIDAAYANGDITEADKTALVTEVNNGDWNSLIEMEIPAIGGADTPDGADFQTLIDSITTIVNGDGSTEEKAAAIAELLQGSSSSTVTAVLDTLHTAGIIDEDMYNQISDALNGASTSTPSDSTGTGNGLTDFISGLLGQLGIGGGSDSGDDTTTTTKANSDFEGDKADTGDYAVISVAGIALAAGIALVLTKKKK